MPLSGSAADKRMIMVSNESPRSAAGISIQLDVPPFDFRESALQDIGEDGSGHFDVVNLMSVHESIGFWRLCRTRPLSYHRWSI